MIALFRSMAAPMLSLVSLILGSGLFNTFVSLRLEIEGYKIDTIGIVTAAFYLGILIGSLLLSRTIAKAGHVRSFILFAAISTVLVLGQAFWVNAYVWTVLRFFGGMCTAGVIIVIESWLLMQSAPSVRGRALALYLGVFYAALSGGQLLLSLSDLRSIYPFYITATLSLLSVLPISIGKIDQPKMIPTKRLSPPQLFNISPLGVSGGVISGMLLAVIYGLVPVYAKAIGMSFSEIGTLMAILIFGGLSLQWPLGRWADRGNRRKVLTAASFFTALLGVAIALSDIETPFLLLILAWLFGGFAFTIYPLSLAYVCEKVSEGQIVAVTGGFVLSYGIGAISGPMLAPFAMQMIGASGLFFFLSFITLLLGIFGLKSPYRGS